MSTPHTRSAFSLPRIVNAWWSRRTKWERLLAISIVTYATLFSILTSLKVYDLTTFAYDLGSYNQALYTTTLGGHFFYYTADLPANPSGSIFGAHFSPILMLIFVPYVFAPSVFTILILQTWAIALGAVPIFYLARRVVRAERFAFVLAIVFLLHPGTQGVNWYDFHPEAFLLFFLPLLLYFLVAEQWKLFLAAAIGALSTIEMAPPLVIALVLGELAAMWWSHRSGNRRGPARKVRFLVLTFALATLWWIAGTLAVLAFNPLNVFARGGAEYWQILGASSITDVLPQAVLHPDRAVAGLLYHGTAKLWYIAVLFGPLLFLTFRSLRATVCCLPWLGVSLLSNQDSFYAIGDQYPAFILPFIFYGVVLGFSRPWNLFERIRSLTGRSPRRPLTLREGALIAPIVSVTAILLAITTPLGPLAAGTYSVGGFPLLTSHAQAVDALYRLIPRDASIMTQNNLFPPVSNRANAYVIPVGTFFPPGSSFNATLAGLVGSVEFILVDFVTSAEEATVVLMTPSIRASYSIYAAADGALLLRRGAWAQVWFDPYIRNFGSTDVRPVNSSASNDPSATSGRALHLDAASVSDFWNGPSIFLPPGSYAISYRLRSTTAVSGTVIRLPVELSPLAMHVTQIGSVNSGFHVNFRLVATASRFDVSATNLTSNNLPPGQGYQSVRLIVNATTIGVYEFPGLSANGTADLWFDGVEIRQLAAFDGAIVPISYYASATVTG
jgi:uncharacterized membrane protein